MKKGDLLLLILYASGYSDEECEPITGRTKITKIMFLFDKEVKGNFKRLSNKDQLELQFPSFFPWKYGPMSKDVLVDLEFFININFIKSESVENDLAGFHEAKEFQEYDSDELEIDDLNEYEYDYSKYTLASLGEKYVKNRLLNMLSSSQYQLIADLKRKYNLMSLSSLLQYVYQNYPKYAEKSLIKGVVLNKK